LETFRLGFAKSCWRERYAQGTPVKNYAYVQGLVEFRLDFRCQELLCFEVWIFNGVKLIFKLLKLSPLIQPSSSSRTRQINREQIRFFLAEKSSPSSTVFSYYLYPIPDLYFICRIHSICFVRCGFSRVSSGVSSFAPRNPTVSSRIEVGQINREQLRFFLAGISSP
jgi:hypothetical protein